MGRCFWFSILIFLFNSLSANVASKQRLTCFNELVFSNSTFDTVVSSYAKLYFRSYVFLYSFIFYNFSKL